MRVLLILILTLTLASCVKNKNGQGVQVVTGENENVFEVSEVIQGNTYTYMKVKENNGERWIATGKTDVEIGDVLYYDEALHMSNFDSKELDRTFEEIWFVNQVSENPIVYDEGRIMPPHNHKSQTKEKSNINLEKKEGELTIGQIYANPQEYAGAEVEIKGIVVKVNNEIMGKNWVHIQDGTSAGENFDLTITTTDKVEVGEEVTFRGKISLDKDFGSGYRYDVIVEEAKLVSQSGSQI